MSLATPTLNFSPDTGISSSDGITSGDINNKILFSGVADPSIQIDLYVDGVHLDITVADSSGNWSYLTSLSQGSHTITATTTDGVTTSASSAPLSLVYDTVAATLTASEAISGLSRQSSDALSGTVSDANGVTNVEVFDGSADLGAAAIDGSGGWSFTASGLVDGSHSFTTVATDTAGNVTAPVSAGPDLVVDTTAPTLFASESIAGLTSATTDVISGTASDANGVTHVEVFDGGLDLGAAAIDGFGNWSFTATGLTDGTHGFTAVATDTAGNVTAPVSAGPGVLVDTTAPTLSVSESIAGLTSQNSDVIFATVSDATGVMSVEVFDGGVDLGAASPIGGGNWTFAANGLSDGPHSFSVVATDVLGNASLPVSAGPDLVVDTTAPMLFAVESAAGPTAATTDVIFGSSFDPNGVAHIEVFDAGVDLGAAVIDGSGNWEFMASGLSDGIHSFSATSTDSLGNATGLVSAGPDLMVDTTAPTLMAAQVVDGLTNIATLPIYGTVSDASGVSAVEVFDGSTDLGAAVIDGAGNWIYLATGLSDGAHSFSAVATDPLGNATGQVSAGPDVLIDTTAPTLAVMQSVFGLSGDRADMISGTAADVNGISHVEVFDGSVDLGAATVDGDGNWTFLAAGLSDGAHSFSAIATDTAGNVTGQVSAGPDLVVDTVTPMLTAMQAISGLTSQSTHVIHGSVLDSNGVANVEVFDGGVDLGAATLDGEGGWSFTASGLDDGNHSFTARATDAAGNATAAISAGSETLIDTTAPMLTAMQSASGLIGSTAAVLSGTVSDANGVVGVEVFDGSTDLGAATIDGDGNWRYTASGLSDGRHSFAAVGTDAAGNATGPVSAGADLRVDTTHNHDPITGVALPLIDPVLHAGFAITNVSIGLAGSNAGDAYGGPLSWLQHQFVWNGTQGIAVAATQANVFLHGGSGDDALQATAGRNVLDGGDGSNFLVGSGGTDGGADTFFVDARTSAPTWSTVVNFHQGDQLTIWGFADPTSSAQWVGQDGAAGYAGATLRAQVSGHDASVTFAGLSTDDANRLSMTTGSVDGQSYLLITRGS